MSGTTTMVHGTSMSERQHASFLWHWSRRRRVGLARMGLRGALIGAAAGLAFCVAMLASMGPPAAPGHTGLSAILPLLERAALLFGMTVPATTAIGWFKARSLFAFHERLYEKLLRAGLEVPTSPPALRTMDRWPAMMVALTFVVIGGFVAWLVWAGSTGHL